MAKRQSSKKGKSGRSGVNWKPAPPSRGKHLRPKKISEKDVVPGDGSSRLNKHLANAGICSRREADVLIKTGIVTVNGKIVTEMGIKVFPGDVVKLNGETIRREAPRYVLLNKPKNFITTMDDPRGRKTVMTLVQDACKERIFPVGRLDRDTTGLLLFTNDGDMAKKLTHPKHGFPKLYLVTLDKKVKADHLKALSEGVKLDDGVIQADKIDYVNDDKYRVGVEIHSGRNRIVRRMFEHFGYKVIKLDRTMFASLTKKDLPRGYYRHLSQQEVDFLKMIS